MKTENNQIKRWILPKPLNKDEIPNCCVNYTLQKVLSRRGLDLDNELDNYVNPENLPNPEDHFSELNNATKRIIKACKRNEKIAICGDYDADGITSTVLLVELLTKLGSTAIAYIPSRNDDGYGLNIKMIDKIYKEGIKLVITVDNGISASEAIRKSKEHGIDLIITDHHKIPNKKLDIYSLIHPEKTPANSPYKYLAGVGIAYLLAKNLCTKLKFNIDQTTANELFCIGTIADMAPLKGANRNWLKECLPKIKYSNNIGIKSIIKKLSIDELEITPDLIAFKIAPLINAVGRIGDPNLVINLLTNDSDVAVKKLTNQCFAINKERKRITTVIESEATELALSQYSSNKKFLVVAKREWHPGVIGIVAARIVDRFNLPTAILSEANDGLFRGSIRSTEYINVVRALDECQDILISYGGHSAAAGFTIKEENIQLLEDKLNYIAIRELKNIDIVKSIKPDAYLLLDDIDDDFYKQLLIVGPFGIMNPAPIFWTRKCKIIDINRLKGGHIRMTLSDGNVCIDAIKWNCSSEIRINDLIDIAYYVEMNNWMNKNKLQLNIIDLKKYSNIVELKLHNRTYKCQLVKDIEILITNKVGQTISSKLSKKYDYTNKKQELFAKKILTFAEIALGKAA